MTTSNTRWNRAAFIWHAIWVAITITFTEVNTILPALVLNVGGTKIHVGILTAIMVGVPMLGQLLFAGFLSSKIYKKPYLLTGINLRVLALAGMAFTLFISSEWSSARVLAMVYLWMLIFTLSGAFAGVSYTDILGKSIEGDTRKRFLVLRQFLSGIGVLISALIGREILRMLDSPGNYSLLFGLAAACLLIASIGFWVLRERATRVVLERGSIMDIFRFIPKYLKEDPNLRNVVILSNLAGFAVTLMPFYIVLARDRYALTSETVGNLLIVSILGLILSNYLWSRILKHYAYRGILITWIVISAALPVLALVFAARLPLPFFLILFFLSGATLSAQRIAQEGILLEISNETNRTLYTGIIGAFNLTIAIFPLVSGILITLVGYAPVFLVGSLSMITSLYFARQINCDLERE